MADAGLLRLPLYFALRLPVPNFFGVLFFWPGVAIHDGGQGASVAVARYKKREMCHPTAIPLERPRNMKRGSLFSHPSIILGKTLKIKIKNLGAARKVGPLLSNSGCSRNDPNHPKNLG